MVEVGFYLNMQYASYSANVDFGQFLVSDEDEEQSNTAPYFGTDWLDA